MTPIILKPGSRLLRLVEVYGRCDGPPGDSCSLLTGVIRGLLMVLLIIGLSSMTLFGIQLVAHASYLRYLETGNWLLGPSPLGHYLIESWHGVPAFIATVVLFLLTVAAFLSVIVVIHVYWEKFQRYRFERQWTRGSGSQIQPSVLSRLITSWRERYCVPVMIEGSYDHKFYLEKTQPPKETPSAE